jgi:hypothetical protein
MTQLKSAISQLRRLALTPALLLSLLSGCESSFSIRSYWSESTPAAYGADERFARAWKLADGSFHVRFGAERRAAAFDSSCALRVEIRLHGYRDQPWAAIVDAEPQMLVQYGYVPPLDGSWHCSATGGVVLSNISRLSETDGTYGQALVEFDEADIAAGRLSGRVSVWPGPSVRTEPTGLRLHDLIIGSFSFFGVDFPEGAIPEGVEEP